MDTFIITYDAAAALRHLLMAVEVIASASPSAAKGAAVHLKDARKRIAALDQLMNNERDRLAERREQLGGIDFHTGRRD